MLRQLAASSGGTQLQALDRSGIRQSSPPRAPDQSVPVGILPQDRMSERMSEQMPERMSDGICHTSVFQGGITRRH